MVQICGAFVLHARSDPWQMVNPQVEEAGVSAGTTVGTTVGSGAGIAFIPPGNTEVQPGSNESGDKQNDANAVHA